MFFFFFIFLSIYGMLFIVLLFFGFIVIVFGLKVNKNKLFLICVYSFIFLGWEFKKFF